MQDFFKEIQFFMQLGLHEVFSALLQDVILKNTHPIDQKVKWSVGYSNSLIYLGIS